jgi:hypothetical protein
MPLRFCVAAKKKQICAVHGYADRFQKLYCGVANCSFSHAPENQNSA